jgi:O-antigen/teichoic acid export membrane protein
MARTSKFVSGTLLGYLYQAAVMLFGLWLTPFNLKVLGQHDYGLWLVGLQLLTFLLLVDFGIVAITPRDVARLTGKAEASQSSPELVALVQKTIRVVLCQTAIVCIGAVVAYRFLPPVRPDVRGPILIAALAFCLSYPFRVYGAILQGLQDFRFLGQLRIVLWAASATITVGLLLLGWRLYALALGWGFNVFAQELVAFVRLRALRPELATLKPWKHTERLAWKDFTRGLWLSVGQVAQLLLTGSDVLAVAKVLGPSTVVRYNCTAKLALVLSNQPQLLAAGALPGLSQMKASESRERILQVSTSLGQAMLIFSGALVCVVFAINQSFVNVWVGPQLFGGATLTMLILANLILRHLDLTLAQSLFAFGYERPMAIKAAADGVVSALAAYACVHWLGIAGASLGLLIGVLFVSLPTNTILFSREFDVPAWRVFMPYVPYAWRVGVVCWAGRLFERYFLPRSYPAIFLTAIFALSLYSALVVPYALRTPLGAYVVGIMNRTRDGLRVWKLRWSL